jgi:thiol-disulfide isomerase/thioredoxin
MVKKNTLSAARAATLILSLLLMVPGAVGGEPPPLEGMFRDNFTLLESPVPAPQTGFLDQSGATVTLAAFRGRVVLLNFWATWCAPCIREMPALDRLQADLGDQGLAVLAVSQDRGGAKVVGPFLDKLKLDNLAIYLDPAGKLGRDTGLRGLPTTLLIDRRGQLVGGLQGPAEWDSPEAARLIRHYLEQPDPSGELTETAG